MNLRKMIEVRLLLLLLVAVIGMGAVVFANISFWQSFDNQPVVLDKN